METAGRTQYLTKAQGMPKNIEKHLEKLVREFTWESNKALIAMKQMALPLRRGGRKVIDIKKRNQAITATDIQTYLRMDDTRPKWAFIADKIFRLAYDHDLAKQEHDPRLNPFIQNWPPAKAARSLTESTKTLLKNARLLRVKVEVDEASEELKRKMPIWMHPGTKASERQSTFKEISKHLRTDHKIATVQDAFNLARTYIYANHQETSECECQTCLDLEKEYSCKNPNACIQQTKHLINKLEDKWKPKILKPTSGKTCPSHYL